MKGIPILAFALAGTPACPQPAAPPAPKADAAPKAEGPEDPERCLDRVLREAGLNRFGDPPDTVYAGGNPLFDEATGRAVPRREYVARRAPELAAKCPARR